jgi:hypothetical protein
MVKWTIAEISQDHATRTGVEVSTVSVDESEQAVPRHAGEHSELQERFAEGTATPRHWDYLNTNFSKTGPLG